MGPQYRKDIAAALDGDFDQKIKEMMERKSLDLQDENQNLLFRQVTGGNEQKLKARDEDEDILDEDEEEDEKADIRIHSPNALQLQKAQISGNAEEIG